MEIGNIKEIRPGFDNEMALSIKEVTMKVNKKNEEIDVVPKPQIIAVIDSLLTGNQLVLWCTE